MATNEREYLLSRAAQEMKQAAAAANDPARSAHEAMARVYAARAALHQPASLAPVE